MNRRIATRGIVEKDGKIFVQKLKHSDDENYFWSTPGGGLDESEALLDGLHREFIEETGITPEVGNLLYVQQFSDGAKEQLEFFFHIKNADDFLVIDLENTSHGMIEVAENGFFDPKSTNVLPEFLRERDISMDIERGRTVFFDYLVK